MARIFSLFGARKDWVNYSNDEARAGAQELLEEALKVEPKV
jgi:hypothetical protein